MRNKVWNPLTKVGEFRLKLYPKDFELVRHFYETVLGFPVIDEWGAGEDEKGVMFDTGVATLELLSPDQYQPVTGCSLSLEVSDVWELWKKFQNGTNIVFGLRDNSWGDTSFKITDPEGFEITFFTKHTGNKSNIT
ncbi:hypothetical protein HY339_03720 [Candidatus Gottesmanbacteria bacterium]|nr:hypothetical protein [Candidatus Gottesmanbacteria bacterium]